MKGMAIVAISVLYLTMSAEDVVVIPHDNIVALCVLIQNGENTDNYVLLDINISKLKGKGLYWYVSEAWLVGASFDKYITIHAEQAGVENPENNFKLSNIKWEPGKVLECIYSNQCDYDFKARKISEHKWEVYAKGIMKKWDGDPDTSVVELKSVDSATLKYPVIKTQTMFQ